MAQGFHFARPMAAEALESWLRGAPLEAIPQRLGELAG
jgi:EAL domain-containing protein (putative c-di-GMP-specific phosphodiesterase class I)